MQDDREPAVIITVCDQGPLIIRGDFVLQYSDQRPIDPHRPVIALCRCGKSAIKPFCDGSHSFPLKRGGEETSRSS
jgi:CDGSH-type Zn-finger protein